MIRNGGLGGGPFFILIGIDRAVLIFCRSDIHHMNNTVL